MKLGFIGCGNMGGALAKSAALSNAEIYLTDKDSNKASELAQATNAKVVDITDIAEKCDYIFLGVKPQHMENMLSEIKAVLVNRKDHFVLVSMAAGLSIETIKNMSGVSSIIRIMPNLAVSVGEGMILYCSENCTEDDVNGFLNAMANAGEFTLLPENLIDAGSAISGCGPAFVFMFIEALSDGGVKCGLPRAKAQYLASQTLLGSAKLLMESDKHPGELKDAVCSPGGTTIEGVLALENNNFRANTASAVIAAYDKTLKLAKK